MAGCGKQSGEGTQALLVTLVEAKKIMFSSNRSLFFRFTPTELTHCFGIFLAEAFEVGEGRDISE